MNPRDDEGVEGPQTRQGFFVGTLQYMAPEQLLGDVVGPSTDQYAIGCLIYRLLSGETPFQGKPTEIASGHLKRRPPALPEDLRLPKFDEVIARAMGKEPEDRYPSCEALVASLIEAWVKSETEGDARATQPLDIVAFQRAFSKQNTSVYVSEEKDTGSVSGATLGDSATLSETFDSGALTKAEEETSHTGMSGALVDPMQPLSGITLAKRGSPKGLWLSWALVACMVVAAVVVDWSELLSDYSGDRARTRSTSQTKKNGSKKSQGLKSVGPEEPSGEPTNTPNLETSAQTEPLDRPDKETADTTSIKSEASGQTTQASDGPTQKKDATESMAVPGTIDKTDVVDVKETDAQSDVNQQQTAVKKGKPKRETSTGRVERERPKNTALTKRKRAGKKRARTAAKKRARKRTRSSRRRGSGTRTTVAAKKPNALTKAIRGFNSSLKACRCPEAKRHLEAVKVKGPNQSKSLQERYLEQCGVVGFGCRKR